MKKILASMKKILTRNIGLKILSLLLAMLVWMAIMNVDDPYITNEISNIQVVTLNSEAVENNNKIYEIDTGETVDIKVRAKRSIFDTLKASDFTAVADFKEMSLVWAVPIKVTVKGNRKYSASDVEIISREPEMMTLTLEDADEQTCRVEVITTGKVKEGYCIVEKIATPNLVLVSGSKKQVSKIKQLVANVNVEGKSESFQQPVEIKAYDENGYPVDSNKLEFETKDVTVDIKILPTKVIDLIVSSDGEVFDGYSCSELLWEPKQITIAGSEEDLAKIVRITAMVDISGLKEQTSINIDIDKALEEKAEEVGASYILVDENKKAAVTAKIEKWETRDYSVNSSNIDIRNKPINLDAAFQTRGQVSVKVSGLQSVLDGLTVADLKLYINLAGYQSGNYYVSIESDTEADVKVSTARINIELTDKSIPSSNSFP